MEENLKQNKVHDEQIIVANLWKKNDFFVNLVMNDRVSNYYEAQLMQILRFFYFNNDF